jgi:hypothetical protein
MYKNLMEDVEKGLTVEQVLIGFAPVLCGKLDRNYKLVPNTELRKKLTSLKAELKHIMALSDAEAEQEHSDQYDAAIAEHEALVIKNTELRKKYTALIEKLKDFDVMPYEDTIGQIQFVAVRDITFAMEQACYIPKASPTRYTGAEWKKGKIHALEMMIAEYEDARKIEKDNINHLYELLSREK